jgi:uncharacterized cupredoxin-like copper-binding protein
MPLRAGSLLRILLVCSAVPAVVLLDACGGSARTAKGKPDLQRVSESDFHINAPSTLKAGEYTFHVHNKGSTDHEFIIAPTQTGKLPLRADGLTVDEEAFERSEPGALEPAASGAVRDVTVVLKPGRYVLFCNMEGHYMAGMHSELVVQ